MTPLPHCMDKYFGMDRVNEKSLELYFYTNVLLNSIVLPLKGLNNDKLSRSKISICIDNRVIRT